MKCEGCGIESSFEEGFIKQYADFSEYQRIYCPVCWIRRRNRSQGRYQIIAILAGMWGFGLIWMDAESEWGRLLKAVFLVDLFLLLTILPHELGHLLAARIVGWRVFAVVVGVGKSIFRRYFCGILFEFRLLPVAGVTQMAPVNLRWFRVKFFLTILGGPLVNALMIALTLIICGNFNPLLLPMAPMLFVFSNVWVLVVNLWPHQLQSIRKASDGKQLLKIFSKTQKDAANMLAARYAYEAALLREYGKDIPKACEWCEQGLALFPDNILLLNMSGVLWLDKLDYGRAREILQKLLPREHNSKTTYYTIMNNLAYVDALTGNPELLPEADKYSKEVCDALPWVPAFVGTRGTVMVAMGNYPEGIKLLKSSLEDADSLRSKAENSCHLVVAYARSGMVEEARKFLELAQKFNPDCRLIPWAQAILANPVLALASSNPT